MTLNLAITFDRAAPVYCDRVLRLFDRISVHETTAETVAFLRDQKIAVIFSDLGVLAGQTNLEWVKIDSKQCDEGAIIALLHEACHVRQYHKAPEVIGVIDVTDDHRSVACWATYVTEADADAHAVMQCYKLAQAGDPAPYFYLFSQPDTADIAEAFEREVGRGIEHGRRAAFEQWFKDPMRVNEYTRKVLSASGPTYNLCAGDLVSYFKEKLMTLGENPGEQNYFALPMYRQIDDPHYFQGGTWSPQKTIGDPEISIFAKRPGISAAAWERFKNRR